MQTPAPARSRMARLLGAAGVLALLAGAPASADTVVTKSGETHFGTIIENTPRMIKIRTVISNIISEIEIPKYKIREYSVEEETRFDQIHERERKEASSGPSMAAEEIEDASAGAPDVVKRDGVPLVLEVPLEGTFGQDIYPKSVAAALEWAVANDVSDIVFRLDSPGGEVWAAQKIVEIMKRHEDDLTYHALVERGISASIWPTFACETITMPPGSTLGGAVVYRMSTGNAEVDSKMNSILRAELSADARARGHEPAVVAAMMIGEAELYAYRDKNAGGPWKLTGDKREAYDDRRNREVRDLDSRSSVLTLTDEDAIIYGVADPLSDRSLDSFASVMGFKEYDDAGAFANDLAEDWRERCAGLRKEIDLTISGVLNDFGRARSGGTYSSVMRNLRDAKRGLADLKRHIEEAQDLEMDDILTEYDTLDHDHLMEEIDKDLADLRLRRRP
ncbi:MAG: hypothetical protein RIB60_07850 [Phycisphaerales bacterium]